MRRDLPSGTVTFLFTDVEGSTRLLDEMGAEAYAAALAEHRRVIREACAAYRGVEVDTQGDAFFFAFPTAPNALGAADALTHALAESPIRVRVGLHTGTPVVTQEGYVGGDVHRAARIAAAGHGGQVLVSASTAALVDGRLRDLGEHRFKDLSAAERVYQLGEGEFPPVKTLYRTNLPIPATPFLGRERELAEVLELLGRDAVRLVTLTGAGGTGKTRLALQVAAEASDRYPDGIWWIPLAALRDPATVPAQIAQALGAEAELSTHIGDKRMLLLLDNFEHVVDAAPGIAVLLGACPDLDVLVTSRELLQLGAEHGYSVPTLSDEDGTALFVARALAVGGELGDEASVEQLCRRLDNLPLALELAAARTRHLTPARLLERLPQRLDLLKSGRDADPRQQTLRATISWSYDLLTGEEQRLFRRVSVFAGGCTLDAAEVVCGADLETMSALVDKSLVRKSGERFWMLQTIREFAAERLDESGEMAALRSRHLDYLIEHAKTLGFTTEGIEAGAAQRHDVAIAELDNFRAAIDWALDADPVLGLRLATELENFWISHTPVEGRRIFEELVGRAGDAPPELEAFAIRCRGNFEVFMGDVELGLKLYQQSLEQYERLGDERSVAVMEHRLAANLLRIGDHERGRRLTEQSIARSRRTGFRLNEAMARGSLGSIDYREGNVERGLETIQQAVELARDAGFKWWEANMLGALAAYTFELDRLDEAEEHARAVLRLARDMGDRRHAVQSLALLAVVAVRREQLDRAGRLWGAVEAEEQRGPLGARPRLRAWADDREEFATMVFADPSPALERAVAAGRLLSLDEAVNEALADA